MEGTKTNDEYLDLTPKAKAESPKAEEVTFGDGGVSVEDMFPGGVLNFDIGL